MLNYLSWVKIIKIVCYFHNQSFSYFLIDIQYKMLFLKYDATTLFKITKNRLGYMEEL